MSNCLLINNIVKTELIGQSTDFSYTGNVQSFTVPTTGIYKLEVWGARGGNTDCRGEWNSGGSGAYVTGYKILKAGDILYICIGGAGATISHQSSEVGGAYNGGGSGRGLDGGSEDGQWAGAPGGGCTHIALNSNKGTLVSYVNNKNEILVVAGGGGGAFWGWNSSFSTRSNGGNSGTGGYNFGQGIGYGFFAQGAGGGGWEGGSRPSSRGGGYGGSDYTGGVPQIKYGGIVYSPSITDGNNSGNGKAKITFYAIAKNLNRAIIAGE